MAAHWKGVNGLGMKLVTLTFSCNRPAFERRGPPGPTRRMRPHRADDGLHIVVGLGGQADHEVQLQGGVPGREGLPGGVEDVGLAHVLVDHVAQALTSRFRSQRHRGAGGRRQVPKADGGRIDSQRRQVDLHLWVLARQSLEHVRDAGVVGRRERAQTQLFVPGGDQLACRPGRRPLAPTALAPADTTCPPGRTGTPAYSHA